jgi:hypothetical protein
VGPPPRHRARARVERPCGDIMAGLGCQASRHRELASHRDADSSSSSRASLVNPRSSLHEERRLGRRVDRSAARLAEVQPGSERSLLRDQGGSIGGVALRISRRIGPRRARRLAGRRHLGHLGPVLAQPVEGRAGAGDAHLAEQLLAGTSPAACSSRSPAARRGTVQQRQQCPQRNRPRPTFPTIAGRTQPIGVRSTPAAGRLLDRRPRWRALTLRLGSPAGKPVAETLTHQVTARAPARGRQARPRRARARPR